MKIRCLLFFIALVVFTACKKDQDTDPQGAPGPAGAQGPQGEPGKNAEVVSTGVIVVQSTQWKSPDSLEWHTTITTTMVTQEVADHGSVHVYVKKEDVWHVLPYLDHTTFTSFAYEVGKVHLYIEDSHGSAPQLPETDRYKITVISDAERGVSPAHKPDPRFGDAEH